ncbi:MAG: WSD1 family O-acyltransferase, partial [Actinomycetota bacterium]
GVELAAMVPVSIREDGNGALGNRVSTIIAPLPIGEADIATRYRRITEGTKAAKSSHHVVGADLLLQLSGIIPPPLVSQIAKFQNTQRFFNLSITNIPGPSEPLYAAGHKLLDIFPFTPLAGNMALIVAVVSYVGQMEFGLTVDAETIPDVDTIASGITNAVTDLKAIASVPDTGPIEQRRVS